MQNNAAVATNVKANLNDVRMQGIALYIDDVMGRPNSALDINVPVSRIVNSVTGLAVTDMAGFIAAIDGAHLSQSYSHNGEKFSNDRVTGYVVVLNNLVVTFNDFSRDDSYLSSRMTMSFKETDSYRFRFYMAYMNDGDSTIPVKITSVRLIKV